MAESRETQSCALSAILATICQQRAGNDVQDLTTRSRFFKENTMRQALIGFVHLEVLRAAAVIALATIACAGLSACATNKAGAASGSSAPNASSAYPNQPDYSDITYRSL
jgi:hypothetical protein